MKNMITKGLLFTGLLFLSMSCDNSEDIDTSMELENSAAFKSTKGTKQTCQELNKSLQNYLPKKKRH